MENVQDVHNNSSQVQTSKPDLRNVEPQLTSRRNILIHTFVTYHWLFLIGILGVFISGGAISLYSLTHVEVLTSEEPNKTRVEVIQAIAPPPTRSSNRVPLWMVAAIALSCASGCLVLCRLLSRPVKPKKYRRQEIRNQKPVLKPRKAVSQANSSVKRNQRKFVQPGRTRPPQSGGYRNHTTRMPTRMPTRIPTQNYTQTPTQIPIKRVPTPKKSMTTILPPQSKSFLIKNQGLKTKESSVDMMDLPKQNSWSNFYQQSKISVK